MIDDSVENALRDLKAIAAIIGNDNGDIMPLEIRHQVALFWLNSINERVNLIQKALGYADDDSDELSVGAKIRDKSK